MKVVFISDAHLKRSTDERYTQMLHFLQEIIDGNIRKLVGGESLHPDKTSVDDLYILGDFFDFWFCDAQHIHPEFQVIIGKLVELQKSGVRIHLCEGNHDFFLKDYFQNHLGMEVIEEWADIWPDHMRILVSHGDTADRSDKTYLMFRKMLRSRAIYHAQRHLPASVRWAIASTSSNVSKEINSDNREVLVEKRIPFAIEKLNEGYDAVVIGHCHIPFIKNFDVQGKKKTFVSLGDWINHYSFLYYEDHQFFLSHFRP